MQYYKEMLWISKSWRIYETGGKFVFVCFEIRQGAGHRQGQDIGAGIHMQFPTCVIVVKSD